MTNELKAHSHADLVRSAYNLLLDRDPEPGGLKHWSTMLANGLAKEEFLRATIASAECRSRLGSPLGGDLDGVDLVVPVGGRQLRVPSNDHSFVPHLLKERSWEPHIGGYLTRTLKPSDVFLDVGANLGYFTVLCAPLVKQVVAFEPVAAAFRYCEMNVRMNGFDNVELHRLGLWDSEIELEMSVDPSSLMSSHVGGGERIRCVPLDGLGISPSVIKMDIEGAEPFALRGMKATLARCRPVIVMELNRPALHGQGRDSADVWAFFRELGYAVSTLEWNQPDPVPVSGLAELNSRCPPDALVDLLVTP